MKEKLKIISDAIDYIEKFEQVTNAQIQKIEENDVKDLYAIIGQMSEGIEWLLSVFKMTEDIQIQKIEVQGINESINNIIEAMENKDLILLKDTFEYELIPQLREWKNDLKFILDHYSE